MRLVSSAFNNNFAFLALTVGKSFMNNKRNKGTRIQPCVTPCLTSSQLEQLTVLVLSFNANV